MVNFLFGFCFDTATNKIEERINICFLEWKALKSDVEKPPFCSCLEKFLAGAGSWIGEIDNGKMSFFLYLKGN